MARTFSVRMPPLRRVFLGASLSLLCWPLLAQVEVGQLVGKVTDAEGGCLMETEIVLTGKGLRKTVRTDEDGSFHLRRLPRGRYVLEVEHEGFAKVVHQPVRIQPGDITRLLVKMSPSLDEVIVVATEPPRMAAGEAWTTIDPRELGTVAVDHDPWSAAKSAAGVVVEPAGARTSSRAPYRAGTAVGDDVLTLDGMVVAGASGPQPRPGGQAVREVRVSTPARDASLPGSGLVVDLVTRGAGLGWRGSLGAEFADRSWQAGPKVDGAERLLLPSRRLDSLGLDVDLGGSLWGERLWGYAFYGYERLGQQAVGGLEEDAELRHSAVKLEAKPSSSWQATLARYRSDTLTQGLGAAPDRQLETTLLEEQPSELLRFDISQQIGASNLWNFRAANWDRHAKLSPLGELGESIELGPDGIWSGGYANFDTRQQTEQWRLEGQLHRQPGRSEHDLRFGVTDRRLRDRARERWGLDNLVQIAGENLGVDFEALRVLRPENTDVERQELAFWLQDSVSLGDLKIDLGFRHEAQSGRNRALQIEANALFPELLPEVNYSGSAADVEWQNTSPRMGLTWGIGQQNRTVLRAAAAAYGSALHADLISRQSPGAGAEVLLGFIDQGAPGFDLGDERFVLELSNVNFFSGVAGGGANSTDRSLSGERRVETRLALERRVGANVVWTLEYERRANSNLLEERRLILDQKGRLRQALASDYEIERRITGELPTGAKFSLPIYRLRAGRSFSGGSMLTNGDRSQSYEGISLGFNRRQVGNWSLRGHGTWSDWRWGVGQDFRLHDDPTNLAPELSGSGIAAADSDGDVVGRSLNLDGRSRGSFLNSRWSFNFLGQYRVAPRRRWGFDVGASFSGREGHPLAYALTVVSPDQSVRLVQATANSDDLRLDDIYTLDLRFGKEIAMGRLGRAVLSLDAFNLLDTHRALDRDTRLNSPQANAILETVQPRVLRLGLRLSLH